MAGTVASHIDHSGQLLAQASHVTTSPSLWVLPVVEDCEPVPQKVRPKHGKRIGLRRGSTSHLPPQEPSHSRPIQEQGAVCVSGLARQVY